MVKLNNKGFAISTMIYSIFLMFVILVGSLLALLSYRKTIFDAHKKAIIEDANKLPSVILKNVSISYDDRLNYSLKDDVQLCDNCIIDSILFEDYEINSSEYDAYLVNLTPGVYNFVYRISKDEISITKMRKISIE